MTRAVAGVVSLALVASAVTAVTVPQRADALPLQQHRPMTYNMQGAADGQLAKWTNTVRTQARTHDVIALQEAGARPTSMGTPETAAQQHGMRVDRYLWRVETVDSDPLDQGGVRNVYFMETDPGGHRVNLAIVTPYAADEIIIIPPSFQSSRPAFGIRLGTTVFFTMHGLSGSGNDDNGLLRQMNQQVTGNRCWVALGDFNREPHRWNPAGSSLQTPGFDPNLPTLPGTGRIYSPNEPTHVLSSGEMRELDYMVTNCNLPSEWGGNRIGDLSSDHVPVEFRPLAADAKGRKKTVISKKNAKALDQREDSRINRPQRFWGVVKNRSTSATQRYSLRTVARGQSQIVNEYNQCLHEVDTPFSTEPNLHTKTFWRPCGIDSADRWRLIFSTVHSGYMTLLNEGTRRCLTLEGEGDHPVGRSCTSGTDASQLWAAVPALEQGDTGADDDGPGPRPDETGEQQARPDVTWNITPSSGPELSRNYNDMIGSLRRAAGAHPFRGNVGQTTADPDRIIRMRVELQDSRGSSDFLTLYLSAHDTRLRGWTNDQGTYQFGDYDLGSRIGGSPTSMVFGSSDASLRSAWTQTGQPERHASVQRDLSANEIKDSLYGLNDYRPGGDVTPVIRASLVLSTVVTHAAHFGAVSHVSSDTLADRNPTGNHSLNDTMYGLFDDWEALSRFTRNITNFPVTTEPLDLDDPDITLRTFKEAENFVILIS
ncbi:hypothetical protein [Actinomadura sp. KC216]|uniref:hypothetical protein n=1 Tax=Actinomadura sp. KC216 TaxID=2530370 RepID=UPI001404E6A5|nr:hypothetical protein [Actinomadura sp. KC216]